MMVLMAWFLEEAWEGCRGCFDDDLRRGMKWEEHRRDTLDIRMDKKGRCTHAHDCCIIEYSPYAHVSAIRRKLHGLI